MTTQEARAFGERVARLRRSLGLTQYELAIKVERTASWMSQVERGVQEVQRLDVLQRLAEALEVPAAEILPPASVTGPPAVRNSEMLARMNLLISGHPAPSTFTKAEETPFTMGEVNVEVEVREIEHLAEEARYDELEEKLAAILPWAEQGVRLAEADEQRKLYHLLAHAYIAASLMLINLGGPEAAWVAADRAVRAAELSRQPRLALTGVVVVARALEAMGRSGQANQLRADALDALEY